MRVEPFTVGSVVHVIKRGARGMEIVRNDADKWRFLRMLYLLNDTYQTTHRLHHSACMDETKGNKSDLFPLVDEPFGRPKHWPKKDPLVAILAWTLMPNHIHLLIEEIREGGVSKFMQRLCGSMTTAFNEKYQETGSIFQGAYKSKTIDTDTYLHHIVPYIAVKNVFELYPGGFKQALREFEKAWQWAETYPFSSFQTHALGKRSHIINHPRLERLGSVPLGDEFKYFAHDMLFAHATQHEKYASLFLEEWE